jgi:hypothetical protein
MACSDENSYQINNRLIPSYYWDYRLYNDILCRVNNAIKPVKFVIHNVVICNRNCVVPIEV